MDGHLRAPPKILGAVGLISGAGKASRISSGPLKFLEISRCSWSVRRPEPSATSAMALDLGNARGIRVAGVVH